MNKNQVVCFVYVHYQTPHLLHESVDRIFQDFVAENPEARIIVVDNSRKLDPEEFASSQIEIIRPEKNLGYAGGINLAVHKVDAYRYVVLNPDVLPLPGCVAKLLDALADYHIVAPKLFLDRGEWFRLPPIEDTGFSSLLMERLGLWSKFFENLCYRKWRAKSERFWGMGSTCLWYDLSGAMLAFTREAFERIGDWDERFFLYFEEADWLRRAKRNDLKCAYVPDARAIHLFSQSTGQETDLESVYQQSKSLFLEKHLSPIQRKALSWIGNGKKRMKLNRLPPYMLPQCPMLLELSYRPSGYPAARAHVECPDSFSTGLPSSIEEQLFTDCYFLRWIDSRGKTFSFGRFVRDVATKKFALDSGYA